jgi:DNA polymerase I-like protein with 3'-5' exonuclease and polymerase domains
MSRIRGLKIAPVAVIDFETDRITPRPHYPPKPVGVAILLPHEKRKGGGRYLAWGHPEGNNCSKREAQKILRQIYRDYLPLFHNGGFDIDVGQTHMDLPWPAFHHDTLLMGFLHDPDSDSLSLKPLAERFLGEKPSERDELRDWIIENVIVPETGRAPTLKGEYSWGGYIAQAPVRLVAPYAIGDCTRTRGLYEFFWDDIMGTRLKEAYAREIKVTKVLINMERRGVPVDVKQLDLDINLYEARRKNIDAFLLKKLKVPMRMWDGILNHYDEQDDFKWAGAKFADRLVSSGLVTHLPLTEKGNPSVSAESLLQVMPAKLAKEFEVRSQMQTCLNTFMKPWREMGRETDGLFHARFNQVRNGDEWGKKTGARTGRLSMTPNLQNMIRSDKDERVPKLRQYIKLVKKNRFKAILKRDYSQQELRILAHYEDDAYSRRYPGKVGPFRSAYEKDPKLDAHILVKGLILATTGLDLDRRPVKDLNFGLIYGQGLALTAEKMGIPREDAKRARMAHAKSLPGIPILQQELKERVKEGEPIWTWGGRRYYCEPPIFFKGRWMTFDYKMLNKLIQGSAADCTKQAMVNYEELGEFALENPLILQVHDELLTLLSDLRLERAAHEMMRDAMAHVQNLNIPMISDGSTSRISYGHMEDVKW